MQSPQQRSGSTDDGTLSQREEKGAAGGSRNSTPDMTHTNNDEVPPRLSSTVNNLPFVPEGALAPSPHRRTQGGGLPHPFEDEYATLESDLATSPPGNDAPPLTAEASYNGNPFVASSDDERKKRDRVRRVKASSPAAVGAEEFDATKPSNTTTPDGTAKKSSKRHHHHTTAVHAFGDFEDQDGATASAMQLNDEDDETIRVGGATIAAGGRTSTSLDPFAPGVEEATLEKNNTALQDDPFTDEGYYRTLAAEIAPSSEAAHRSESSPPPFAVGSSKTTPVPTADPFAQFGAAPFDSHVGGGNAPISSGVFAKSGSILRTDGSIIRKQSVYGPDAQRKEEFAKNPSKPRRQSVAMALSQSKPSERAQELAGPIDVVSTMPLGGEDIGRRRNSEAAGGQIQKRNAEDYSAEDAASVDKAAEQLFMPSMKREQYIPVRVAREKIKLILSEMAQMKLLHLNAIDTMEKQHQFLKAQLETACAAYCRKLTSDYNNRVIALNLEFKKRLATTATGRNAGIGGGGAGDKSPGLGAPLTSSTPPLPRLASSTSPASMGGATDSVANERAAAAEARLQAAHEEIRVLKIDIERIKKEQRSDAGSVSRGPSQSPPPPGSVMLPSHVSADEFAALRKQALELEAELRSTKLQLDSTISIVEADALKQENEELRHRVSELESEVAFYQRRGTDSGDNMVVSESAYNY